MTRQASPVDGGLLPCPFCGKDMDDDEDCFQVSGFVAPSTPAFVVRCDNPNCNAYFAHPSRDAAIAAWNRRATQPGETEA